MKKSQQSKIKDNHSYSELSKQVDGMKNLVEVLGKTGLPKGSKLPTTKEILQLSEKIDQLSSLPDKFNHYFSSLGWIAYESMKADLMKQCVEFAENKKMEEAEELLVEYFDEGNIKTHIMWLKNVKLFLPRWELAQNACKDYVAGRYYSSIPILLLTIDGFVNDVAPDQKGFFAENPDVTAWDSIAGHSSGLEKLAEIFGTTRKRTTTEELTIPYRNGIIHGRDINYANKVVAAKVWSALFAVGDWAKQVQTGKKEEPNMKEKKITWGGISQQLQNTEKQKKLINRWEARKLEVGEDFPETGTLDDYGNGTPEKMLVEFLDLINEKNYGEMAKRITNLQPFSKKAKAGELRNKFENIQIQRFSINEISDEAPAISEIVVVLDYKNNNQKYSKEIIVRMIFQADVRSPLVRGSENGSWKIFEWCFDSII